MFCFTMEPLIYLCPIYRIDTCMNKFKRSFFLTKKQGGIHFIVYIFKPSKFTSFLDLTFDSKCHRIAYTKAKFIS